MRSEPVLTLYAAATTLAAAAVAAIAEFTGVSYDFLWGVLVTLVPGIPAAIKARSSVTPTDTVTAQISAARREGRNQIEAEHTAAFQQWELSTETVDNG